MSNLLDGLTAYGCGIEPSSTLEAARDGSAADPQARPSPTYRDPRDYLLSAAATKDTVAATTVYVRYLVR